jgi:hypothetical protein
LVNKYNFLFVLLIIVKSNAMEEYSLRSVPELTSLCADFVANRLVEAIKYKKELDWFAKEQLPDELDSILKYSLIKRCGAAFWKNSRKKLVVETLFHGRGLIGFGVSSDSNFLVVKHFLAKHRLEVRHPESAEVINIKTGDLLDHFSPQYERSLKSTKIRNIRNRSEKYFSRYPSRESIMNVFNCRWLSRIEIFNVASKKKLYDLDAKWLFDGKISNCSIEITPNNKFVLANYDLTLDDYDNPDHPSPAQQWHSEQGIIWDASTGAHLHTIFWHRQYRWELENKTFKTISNDSSLLVTVHKMHYEQGKYFIEIYDIEKGTLLNSFDSNFLHPEEKFSIKSLAISPDNQFIVFSLDVCKHIGIIKAIKIDLADINLEYILNELSDNRLYEARLKNDE